MDFIRNTSEKVKLWQVEHFFPPFFSRSVLIGGKFIFCKKIHYKICKCCNFNQSALIWKKTGEKSVQLVRVSLFRKYFLWNPYFNYLSIWPFMRHPWFPTRKASKLTFIGFQHQVLNTLQGLDNWSWKQINVSFEAFLVGNQGWHIKGQMLR